MISPDFLLYGELVIQNDEVAMKKTFMLVAAILTLVPTLMFAAADQRQTQYDLGSQMFTFKAGPTIPLFTYTWGGIGADTFRPGIGGGDGTHLKVGGYGSISYQAFVSPYVALGGEIGYSFSYSMSNSLYTLVPIQAKVTFMPVQGTIDLPISLGIGGAYNRYVDNTQGYDGSLFSMFASIEVGLNWYFTENWGVGVNCGYWVIPEFYSKKANGVGCFLPVTLSINYRH